jgi:hypothetical protein
LAAALSFWQQWRSGQAAADKVLSLKRPGNIREDKRPGSKKSSNGGLSERTSRHVFVSQEALHEN